MTESAEQGSANWPMALRIVHLGGGCRAVNQPGRTVELRPTTVTGKTTCFDLARYESLYGDLLAFRLSTIGLDFYTHEMEIDGRSPPEWRPIGQLGNIWQATDASQLWAEIAFAAHGVRNAHLWDVGLRIRYQLRVVAWRLRQISVAYESQLSARVKQKEIQPRILFEDGYTWLCYLAIQSFLVDACVLRDRLAEFSARHVFGPAGRLKPKWENITTLAGLRIRTLSLDADDLLQHLHASSDEHGWLRLLDDYRTLVVHYAPLSHARHRLYMTVAPVDMPNGDTIPAIRCPLPDSPRSIWDARQSGDYLAELPEDFGTFADAARGEIPSKDGLSYCHEVMIELASLAVRLAARSPIAATKIVIPAEDIIDSRETRE